MEPASPQLEPKAQPFLTRAAWLVLVGMAFALSIFGGPVSGVAGIAFHVMTAGLVSLAAWITSKIQAKIG
jgi:hypothetical protein